MLTEELRILTEKVIALSKETGQWMKEQTVSESIAELKTENNLVTFVDKEAERRFVEGLRAILPEAGFVAEEGTGEKKEGGLNWVIDPLDGTTNFVHNVPIWCTSVALSCDRTALPPRALSGVVAALVSSPRQHPDQRLM